MYRNTNQIRSKLLQLAQKVCGLDGIPSDTAFWSLERVIWYIIENCECGGGGGGDGVSGINYNPTTNVLTVTYNDGTPTKTIQLTDKYLEEVTVDTANYLIQFILNDGEELDADLSTIFANYYTKIEVDDIAADNSLVWESF